ncbi:MAG: hypothetical protein LH629_13080 [Ignavibacteria bacterium]|nr:hypothetical protein [Ignavibacteria bacterium]
MNNESFISDTEENANMTSASGSLLIKPNADLNMGYSTALNDWDYFYSGPLKKSVSATQIEPKFSKLKDREEASVISADIDLSEGVIIRGWKILENVSSKVIGFDDETVFLECLVDKENKQYEEREFLILLFEGLELKVGKYFKLCTYRRMNQIMMEVIDNPKLILEDDFPKFDFREHGNFPLKKRD